MNRADTYEDFVAWRDAHDGEPLTTGDAARYFTGTPYATLIAWWARDRQEQRVSQAGRLGTAHGRAGTTPYGDLDADDSALMTALGETSPTTEDNHPRRLALLEAYRDAYQTAREG